MTREQKDICFEPDQVTEILNYYNTFGYVTINPLLSSDELQEVTKLVDESMGEASIGNTSSFDTSDFILKVPEIVPHVFKKQYLHILKKILGCDTLEIQHSKYNAKSPKGGSSVALHQDFPYFPHTDHRLLAFNIHFDGSSPENGGMYCYAGTWSAPIEHDDMYLSSSSVSKDSKSKNTQIRHFLCPPGGVSIHSSFLPHASSETSDGRKRRMGVYQIRHPDNKQIGGAIWKCSNLNPETMEYNDYSYSYNGKHFKGRRLWEPKEYFD